MQGQQRWLVAPYGAVPWVLNARAAGQVRLRRGRDRHDYTLRQLPPAETGPILQRYIRSSAGVFFVLPLLAVLLPASISDHLAQYLPSNAGSVIWGGAALVPNALSPWTGFALLCGYAVVLVGAGAWRLRRSDA
jgi:hypothetical protein